MTRPAKRPRRLPPGGPPRRPWLVALLISLSFAGALAVWWFTTHPAPKPIAKDLERSKLAASQANQFVTQKRFREAQAAYREAVAYAPSEFWQLHFVLAATAAQISVENTTRAGISQPYSRSSVERVAAMREALAEFEVATQLVDTPQGLAKIYSTRAETYITWGQMWDALGYMDAASRADTSDAKLAQRAAELRYLMSHPEGAKTLEASMQAAKAAAR